MSDYETARESLADENSVYIDTDAYGYGHFFTTEALWAFADGIAALSRAAAPEPGWEYRYAEKLGDTEYTYGPEHDEHGWFSTADEASAARVEDTDYVVRRRPAGPVEPLPVGGEN